ncbi:MAG TPA: hypothetical protein VFT49_01090 [Candidatus Saccharimonadales bacterium]|nr:hypothetical protein [Candidatus Saccharimonadales bacterium]
MSEGRLAGILGVACRDLREGRNLHALQLFGSLVGVEFTYQRDARLGEATALARMGRFSEAEDKLQQIVNDYSERTVFKADSLRALAEVRIVLGNLEGIDDILEEAAQIYQIHSFTRPCGAIVHLQALVAMRRGDMDEAVEKIRWATTLTEIKIPDVVPAGFGSIEPLHDGTVSESTELMTLVTSAG